MEVIEDSDNISIALSRLKTEEQQTRSPKTEEIPQKSKSQDQQDRRSERQRAFLDRMKDENFNDSQHPDSLMMRLHAIEDSSLFILNQGASCFLLIDPDFNLAHSV